MDTGSLFAGLALIAVAYLLGSVPSGVVLGRLLTGIDLRGHGSGSIGTTNALRVYGWRISAGVLVMDLLKGVIPVVAGRLLDLPAWAVALGAVAATVGHCWSLYLRGGGGKGVATGGAAVIALSPWALVAVPVLIVIVAATRYVSLASVVLAAGMPVFLAALALFDRLDWWVVLATALIGAVILYKHRSNIERLRAGTENRFGQRVSTAKGPVTVSAPTATGVDQLR